MSVGIDAIEIDVLPAVGGEPVVFHDLTSGRLTDALMSLRNQPVWVTPIETLRDFSVLGSRESIPLFAETMATIPPDIEVHVERKHPVTGQPRRELATSKRARGRERWRELVRRVADILSKHDHKVIVLSFYESALGASGKSLRRCHSRTYFGTPSRRASTVPVNTTARRSILPWI